jgi:hypothetical protein
MIKFRIYRSDGSMQVVETEPQASVWATADRVEKFVDPSPSAPDSAVRLEPYLAAALRHADGLTAQLEARLWQPHRSHIEQARNTIRNLVKKVREVLK